ncbi:MAG: hypothetical protein Q9201_000779 [Fulgogasparrea decipioides]
MRSSLCGSTQGLPTQKLSKPPTNSSSSNLLAAARQEPEPGSPLVPSDADSGDGYFPSMAQASRRRQNTRSKIRSYLYGPGQEAGQFHSSEDEDNSPGKLANVARDVRRRLSRTDSSALPTSSVEASVASSTSRPYTADHLGPDLDEDEVMKEQIKEKVWTDMLAAQNHVSSPIDEDKHPDSVKSPIRRRSLYTPGIATRSPEDILRKPPPPEHLTSQATQDYYYNPARPESSPLSRLANLRSSYTGRSTPSELDYTHLGALKLGTLRVTNGAASPIPRDQDISPVLALGLETTSQDDYYTASEGGRSEEDGRLDRLSGNMSHPLRVASTDVIAPFSEISPSSAVRSFQSGSTVDMSANSPGPGICGQNTDELGSPASVGSITPNIRSIKRKPLPSTAAARQAAQNRCTTTGDVLEIPASPCSLRWSAHHGQNKPMNQQQAGETTGSEVTAPPKRQERNSDLWRSFIQSAEQCHADSGSREDALLALTRNQSYREEYGGASEKVREQLIAFPRDKDSKQLDSGYSSNISLGSNETSLSEKSRTIASSTSPQHMRSPAPHPPETSFEPDLSDIFTNDNVFGARETPRLPCGLDTDVLVRLEVETQRAGPLIQPHYMSTGQPCAGIRDPILMDDVERIRQRSQSLAGHTLPVNEDIEDRKNIPQKPARPHSMYFGAPPIPALPVAKVTQSISGSQTNSAAPRASRYYQEPAVVASAPVSQAVYQTQIHPDGEAMEKSSCTAAGALAADDSVSIEELIDRLLDAPDHEAREIVLQQIRQHRRKAPAGSNDACQRISEAQKSHPFHTAVGMVKRENLPVKPSPINHSRTEAGKPKVAANKNARPQTMFVSAPPMPPLPSAERLQQQEAQKSASKFVRSKTLTPPQSHSPEVSKKDLWAGCAIQTEHKKAIESHTDWSPHRLAWSHRRKSAGEALLRTDQPFGQVDDTSHASGHADTLGETASPPSRAMTAGSENLSVPKAGNRAFHKPWASVQGQQISPAPSESPVQPSSKIAAPAQAFERLTGRFEGGLMYGYEPGFGLGGSAGTRSVKTGATRKSVQMSQGYGVDLSDVPIFVAPSN